MKLPSLDLLITGFIKTFQRFPLVILAACVSSFTMMYLTSGTEAERKNAEDLIKVVLCCQLGICLFLAFSFVSESFAHSQKTKWGLQFLGIGLLVGYFISLPEIKNFEAIHVIRTILFGIGLHLLVSFSPFIKKNNLNGFWQFNKTLFLRILLSGLYSGVLFIGLALAITAIRFLFDVDIKDTTYANLWFFLAGIFNTWFFLAGMPENIGDLENETNYPKGLKIFTQFVLLPLVTVYLLILYAYTFKRIIMWSWPIGWVSYLVIGFSVFGILSILLVYPVREKEENKWIKIFSKWFYVAIYPLVILLCLAIYKRVAEYGITENRYFVLLIAAWLSAMSTYFLINKGKNIKIIPISLFFIAFLSSFGPWGAFSVSEKSQINRLEKILTEENILVDGKIKTSKDTIKGKNAENVESIIKYLGDIHGYDGIQKWFTTNINALPKQKWRDGKYIYKTDLIIEMIAPLNSEPAESDIGYNLDNSFFNFGLSGHKLAKNVRGYDYFLPTIYMSSNPNNGNTINILNDTLIIKPITNENTIIFEKKGVVMLKTELDSLLISIKRYSDNTKKPNSIPAELFNYEAESESLKIKFCFHNIHGRINEEKKMIVNSADAEILLKFK